MNDQISGAANRASTANEVHNSAVSLALGLGLALGGWLFLRLLGWLFPPTGPAGTLLLFVAGAAILVGLIQTVVGVYQLAHNVDRMAKAVLKKQHD
ncbi:hypothetical protein ACIGB8_01870 [Promicromonospora sukumoe]|uniref:hypothetical protein n=1 Tax=Promicromonospora sukumoe TaxID=88382 RepID=UPI0037C9C103